MTKDDLRDSLALIGAKLSDDEPGQRIIREHADPGGLVDALLLACTLSVRLLAEHDGVSPDVAVARLQGWLRKI